MSGTNPLSEEQVKELVLEYLYPTAEERLGVVLQEAAKIAAEGYRTQIARIEHTVRQLEAEVRKRDQQIQELKHEIKKLRDRREQ